MTVKIIFPKQNISSILSQEAPAKMRAETKKVKVRNSTRMSI
jgi:hypothetical protein